MPSPSTLQTRSDAAAIFVSGLCLLHCLVLPVIFVILPAGAVWVALPEQFHLWMLGIVMPVSLVAMYVGRQRHRSWRPSLIAAPALLALTVGAVLFHGLSVEIWFTVASAIALSGAHFLNRRYARVVTG